MHEKLETLYDLCETVDRELTEANEKIRQAGGKLSAGDVDYLDKLTHMLKSIKTTVAMMEAEEEGGYSGRSYRGGNSGRYGPWGMSYEGGNSMRGGRSYEGSSYARGRNNNPTGRNQYSREGGYSYAEDMESTKEEIRELSQKMPEEHRRKIERALEDLR